MLLIDLPNWADPVIFMAAGLSQSDDHLDLRFNLSRDSFSGQDCARSTWLK
jgi:hypothetical protein